MNGTKYWLWLTMVFGVGSKRVWEAMSLFSTPQEAYNALSGGAPDLRLTSAEMKNIRSTDLAAAEQLLESAASKGIYAVGYGEPGYPPQLRHIAVPPALLYYKGNISCLTGKRTVTAVGTRNASEYGIRVAREVCRELAMSGIVIISGFALGTDITAQLAAADAGRPSACVLGCGIDTDYPRGNIRYREHILETGGVFVSEYPPGTPPHSQNFPCRNRILAALGRVTLVFEASAKSGSLITANLAVDQGRELFCLPPYDIMSSACSGNSLLIRQGAAPLLGVQDVLDCFRIGSPNDLEIRQETAKAPVRMISEALLEKQAAVREKMSGKLEVMRAADIVTEQEVPDVQQAVQTEPQPKAADFSGLEENHRRIAELMLAGPVHADYISQSLGMDASELMTELTEMEIAGVIRSLPGKMFEICR
ncbi:MAG: DNA-processing protein DprA [Ruminococcus sp.]|nr:DNA-processing protein DprA [Ruminococcus sp.]